MRSMLAATALMLVAASATAQTPAAPVAPRPGATSAPVARPKPATPAIMRPADPAAQAERLALQSDLTWAADYNGAITGEANERMNAAIKAFQKNNGGATTGTLTPQERALLAGAAKKQQDNVGWTIVGDPVTGARLGVPLKLVPQQSSNVDGARWASTTGTIQIVVTRRKEAAATIAAVAEREKKEPAGRRIDYAAIRPDFFVLSGMQGLKKFYVRGQIKDGDVKLMTILYDQATEGTMAPVVIAMSSAFTAFPAGAQAGVPVPRKKVEYATGVVISADGVVTGGAAVDGCASIVVPGHGNAERVAQDKTHDLALLRLYGARGLTPAAFSTAAMTGGGDIVGIADPQNQGGAAVVSSVKASVMETGGTYAVSPAPGAGFSGAAFFDGGGKLLGILELRQLLLISAANGAPAALQAALAPAAAVRAFLTTNGIAASDAAGGDARASVVRVICVRK